jgi:raffinose/stachyose/melibiose transport system permease protein
VATVSVSESRRVQQSQRAPGRRKKHGVRFVLAWVAFAVALVLAVIWLFPVILVVLTAVQKVGLLSGNVGQWFTDITLANFPRAWGTANLGTYMLNSAIISIIKVPLNLLISCMCAFGLSRFRFRFRGGLLIVLIALIAVPIQIALISIFRMELDAGLLNTYAGLILAYLAFGVPFQVVFLTAYFNQIPVEIEESARVDGSGPWRYLFTILMPLSRPLLAALFVLDFVATWNEFPIALTLLQQNSTWTVPLGLLSFQGPFSTDYTLLCSAIVIAALPVVIVYIALQRYFVSGLTAGAVKG